jgi:hypothetical protein
MIFNAYNTLESVNTSQGIHMVFVYVNDITGGMFTRLLLLAFFIILGIGAYLTQKRSTGNADLPSSLAIAGFITSGLSILMSFIDGMIHTFDIVVTFSATILFVLWMFMSKKKE